MVRVTRFPGIEKWYSGKALGAIQSYVLPMLAQAEAEGCWPKGASRKVRAALNKQAVALKFANANDRRDRDHGTEGLLSDVSDDRRPGYYSECRGWLLVHNMMFGQFARAREALVLADALKPHCVNDAERHALALARQWAQDFAPVAELVVLLDSRRPRPVLVCKTLSRTVLDNVGRAMDIDLDSIEAPKMEMEWVETLLPNGQVVQMPRVKVLWPEGTRHDTSRFAYGVAFNQQCHACGHAIKNPFNWVPLLAQTPQGPVSLWVGRDCAKNLFECEVSGEALYDHGAAAVR
jgi:hypothetical protein